MPMLDEIGQIAITVSDVDRSIKFYRDVLGLRFMFSAGPGLAFLSAGTIRIMLTAPEGEGSDPGNSVLYFKTDQLEDAYQVVLSRGAAAEDGPHKIADMPDHELWMAFVRDPDGNLVGLMEERRGG
jgi:catechol 2,3-dioxygenase-like lactoylglutathione lyase family enzyme